MVCFMHLCISVYHPLVLAAVSSLVAALPMGVMEVMHSKILSRKNTTPLYIVYNPNTIQSVAVAY